MALETHYQSWLAGDFPPPWQRKPNFAALLNVFAQSLDGVVEGLKTAVKARFPLLAPDDALPYIGAERMLERYPGESVDSYRTRIVSAWGLYEKQGTHEGVLSALVAAGFTNAGIYTATGDPPGWWLDPWPPTDTAANWSRFWVDLVEPFSIFGWEAVTYGEIRKFGPSADQWTWGSTATPDQVAFVRRLIRKWKPAHTVCEHIYVHLPDGGPTIKWRGAV